MNLYNYIFFQIFQIMPAADFSDLWYILFDKNKVYKLFSNLKQLLLN